MVIQGPGLEEDEDIHCLDKAVRRVFGTMPAEKHAESCFLLEDSVTRWVAELPRVPPRT